MCHIFYNIFSIIFVKSAMLHPLKKPSKLRFLRWHHLSIISQLAYLEQKTLVCAYLLTGYLITIALHVFLQKPITAFLFLMLFWHFWHVASANCVCMSLWTAIEWKCNAIVNRLSVDGKRHTIVFCSKYASWLMIDRWCHLKNLSLEGFLGGGA